VVENILVMRIKELIIKEEKFCLDVETSSLNWYSTKCMDTPCNAGAVNFLQTYKFSNYEQCFYLFVHDSGWWSRRLKRVISCTCA